MATKATMEYIASLGEVNRPQTKSIRIGMGYQDALSGSIIDIQDIIWDNIDNMLPALTDIGITTSMIIDLSNIAIDAIERERMAGREPCPQFTILEASAIIACLQILLYNDGKLYITLHSPDDHGYELSMMYGALDSIRSLDHIDFIAETYESPIKRQRLNG